MDEVWRCVQQWKKSTLVWQGLSWQAQSGLLYTTAHSSPEAVCQLSHDTCKSGSWFPLISRIPANIGIASWPNRLVRKVLALTHILYSSMVTGTLPSQLGN